MSKKNISDGYSDDTRIALLEHTIGDINKTLERFEKRFDRIDERFDRVDEKFDKMNDKIDSNFKWMLTFIVPMFVGILGLMAHAFKWI